MNFPRTEDNILVYQFGKYNSNWAEFWFLPAK